MNNPGLYSLGDFTIGAAATQVGDWVDITGALSALVSLRLAWGSAGTTVRAWVQTSGDGVIATDIACVLFGVASEHELLNFSALTPKTTQVTSTDGTLADDTAVDGIVGTKMRLKVVSTGTYAGSTVLSARVTAR